jgi:hypothetical protein
MIEYFNYSDFGGDIERDLSGHFSNADFLQSRGLRTDLKLGFHEISAIFQGLLVVLSSLAFGKFQLSENAFQQSLDVLCLNIIDRELLGKIFAECLSETGLSGLIKKHNHDPSAKEVI